MEKVTIHESYNKQGNAFDLSSSRYSKSAEKLVKKHLGGDQEDKPLVKWWRTAAT